MSDTVADSTRLQPSKTAVGESRLIRYAPLVLLAGTVVFVVRFAATPLTNFDTYFHLRFGSEFLNGNWSLTDPGSVTRFATAHWVPTQWSSEVIMATAEKIGGLGAVAWLFGAVLITYVLVLYRSARFAAGPLPAMLTTILALFACTTGLSARPQMVSYILTAIFTVAWLRTGRDGRVRWWLIPLTWYWATAHGMWPTGLSISVVAAAALFADARGDRRQRRNLILVPLLSAVAAVATPVGPSLYGAVLSVNSRRSNFSEWGPPVWTALPSLALVLGLVIVIVTAARSASTLSWLDTGLIVTALGWALYSGRTLPVAAAMLVPFVARALQTWLPQRSGPPNERRLLVVIAVCGLGLLAVLVPSLANRLPTEPAWVETSLGSLPTGTVLLDDEGYGGYLMWRFPQLQLVMHGYGDTFTAPELQRTSRLTGIKPGWIADVRNTGAHWALLSTQEQLTYELEHTQGWYVVHEDKDVVLLHAPPRQHPTPPVG